MSKIKEQFGKLKSIVLNTLGREDFEQVDGKATLSKEDESKLGSAFTPAFIEKFKQGLDTEVALAEQETASAAVIEQLNSDNSAAMQDMTEKVNLATARADALAAEKAALETEKAALESEKATMKEAIDVLSVTAGDDDAEVINGGNAGVKKVDAWMGIKPNAKHFHTAMAAEAIVGNTAKLMQSSSSGFGSSATPGMAGATINVDEVYDEFGTYLSQTNARLEIIRKLTAKTESQTYMTTKMAITDWRAATALITSVVQQFIAKWTPLGDSKFTPITIKNRHHKVNLPITPDDINDSWMSYLYDEQLTPDQMPVTRYIIEQLLRPRIDSDIEMLLIATGEYEALSGVSENDAGQATGKGMDGYITILKSEKASGSTAMNFFTPSAAITADSIVDIIEEYADWVENEAPLYAKRGMNLFIDPVLYKQFKRKYRELYPTTKNEDASNDVPDFSKLLFVPLEAMRGSNTFFSTPKENFVRLIHKNAAGGETKLFLQVERYTVMVFAEFWLGVGFALAELVFAYVPDVDASGSGA